MEPETDWLTGLMSGCVFLEHLEKAAKGKGDLSVLLLDVDRFAHFNHDFGHTVGDDILCKMTAILQQNIHETNKIARYGGNEFAILLMVGQAEAEIAAEKLRVAIAGFSWPNRAVTVSIVVASLEPGQQPWQELTVAFTEAMLEAKLAGGNCVRFSN